ncbi:1091_t:CDS:2 [Funneliformis mosseae]|uniref:1091_t:CDS:1 n=1 Tax=Funneliformis mosseae TaxID=27381 RepID=A0A9N9EWB1_FUNMO|nr:1091_t:CDS:2 [Funneliformis mosseae]
MDKEPRLKSSKFFDYKCSGILGIHKFFIEEPASKWCLEAFMNKFVDEKEMELSFEQIQELFLANLRQITNQKNVDSPIRAFCTDYTEWIQSWKGQAVSKACKEFYEEWIDIGISLRQKRKHKEIAEDFVSENAKYIAFQNTIIQRPQRAQTPSHQSRAQTPPHQSRVQTPPPRSPRSLTPTTPNKRMIEHEKIVCVFGTNKSKSEELVGKELANKISSYRKRIPSTWTSGLEKYLKDVFNKTEKQFKLAIQEEIIGEDGNKFRVYCEKVLMEFYNLVDVFPTLSRKIKERKFTIYHISPLFKLYESTFGTLEFDWIESHAQSAKIMKSSIDSGIVLVDVNGVRVRDYKEIFHMEVSGPPSNPTIRHTTGDTKKTLHTDILNLVDVLSDHLDLDVKLAKEVKVYSMQVIAYRLTLYALSMMEDGRFIAYELSSAELPFDFDSRSKYMAVLRMMAIFHDEMVQQAVIMNEIDSILIPSEGTCVRDVLKIPENLRNL